MEVKTPQAPSQGGAERKELAGKNGCGAQWQVLQDFDEQVVQLEDEALRRLEPPPIPKPEISLRTSPAPHSQMTSFSFPTETRHSNLFPHFLHSNSYSGITPLFYRNRVYLTSAMASISTLTSRGSRATWTAARAGLGALKNSA